MSESDDRPSSWHLRVRAAYHRACGDTQAEAGQKVSRTSKTIYRWENDPSWPEAMTEARERWMQELVQESRSTLLRAIKAGDSVRAMQVIERVDKALHPAPQRTEVSGPQGGPIEVDVDHAREKLTDELTRIAERRRAASGAGRANGR